MKNVWASGNQGDQIGQIFANGVMDYLLWDVGIFLKKIQ
jgi:hypothetical protein